MHTLDSKGQITKTDSWQQLFPFQSQSLPIGDVQLRYVDEGQGEPILMVHGNPTWSFFYHRLISELSTSYRCVAPDHIGCGRSDKPQNYSYTLDQHIKNLFRLIETLDLQSTTLVAHDWGGAIGLGALLKTPSRFSRIILLNTGAFPPPFIPARIKLCRFPWLGQLAVQGANLFARAATVMATNRPDGLPPEVIAGLLVPYDNWANRIATYQFVRDIPVSPRQATWQRLAAIEALLPTLKQKKLLIWGMRDWCFRPECLDRFLNLWPDADIEKLSDAGHYVLLDEPTRVLDRIKAFLASADGTKAADS